MSNNLDTLLTALYVHLDDWILPALGCSRTHRRGRKPVLTDAELLCLAVAVALLEISSERRWIRYARKHLTGTFPHLPGQSGYGKRLRAADRLGDHPNWPVTPTRGKTCCGWWTPPHCPARHPGTVKRSDLAGDAGYGYCASHSRFFWGFLLYLICTPEGMPIIWSLANPKLGEREVT